MDCYPRRQITNEFTLDDLNQAIIVNPCNSYQGYDAATNMGSKAIITYMNCLLPNHRNVTYSGAGALSPVINDLRFNIIGSGTQSSPQKDSAARMNEMSTEYLRAATMTGYGVTMYVGCRCSDSSPQQAYYQKHRRRR